MASKDIPLSELLFQDPDPIVDLTSPLNSVDDSSKDRVFIQEELEKRLKQRVGRQDLVERNILPPLPTAPKLFTNTQQLQRAQIVDNLQKKMRNRPGRDDLLQMNILPALQPNIDPALQAKQLQLKKSKLADTLNDKLANRPGPLQLLQNGIIEPQLSKVVKGYETDVVTPPKESPSKLLPNELDSSLSPDPSPGGSLDEAKSPPDKSPQGFNSPCPPVFKTSLSVGSLSTSVKAPSPGATRKKQQKKYRKLRYHEYVPPSKTNLKGGKTNPKPPSKSDGPYSALLQQQQLFLQLQVLQQQYPNGVLMQKLPEMINSLSKEQKALAVAAAKGRISVTSPSDMTLGRQTSLPQILPVEMPNKHNASSIRFDDLKVNDLKAACKEMGMIVSGKKAELVERLMDHNKGMLPSSALPDNPMRDNRRQAFCHGSSIDSQLSNSTTSPTSPTSSPVFKFPADRGGHESGLGVGYGTGTGTKQSNRMQLPEVISASSLHKEFNEMIERQKRNYICQKGMSEKSIAPRPELTDLLAFKLIPTSYPTSTASHTDQRGKGGTLSASSQVLESISHLNAEKSSQSLPSSPKSNSNGAPELMESCSTSKADHKMSVASTSASFTINTSSSSTDTIMSQVPMLSGLNSISLLGRSTAHDAVGGVNSVSQQAAGMGVSGLTTSYYQQQQQVASHQGMRPGRSSVPVQPVSHPTPHSVSGLPSYNSVMRSRSITGAHPPLGSLGVLHSGMNSGGSFSSDMSGLATPPNEIATKPMNPDLFVSDDVPMDTEESSISDIFAILRAEEFNESSQPLSLPALSNVSSSHRAPHSSLPHTPQYGSSPTKVNNLHHHPHQDSTQSANFVLCNIMPFGNPPLSAQNKSGSDVCLNVVEGRESQKNSIGGYMPNSNLVLGNDLNWLDLDNTSGLGLSPTLGNTFGNLSSHSNPGSLPHDQFHNSFLEDGMSSQMVMMGGLTKNSNPAMNGFGMSTACGGGMPSFLEPGLMHQAGLYSTSSSEEERRLLELGLSTS